MTALHGGAQLIGEGGGHLRAGHDHAVGDGEAPGCVFPDAVAVAAPAGGGARALGVAQMESEHGAQGELAEVVVRHELAAREEA